MAFRTWLFAPANHPRRAEKALASEADVVVLDLEDACPEAEKPAARAAVRDWLSKPRKGLAYVRVNAASTGLLEVDLEAAVGEGLDGVMLPKADNAADVVEAERIIGLLERRHGLPEGRIDLVPLVESAVGLAHAGQIGSASRRVRRLAFGSVDFALDLGLHPGPDEAELTPYRAQLVLASRVEALELPIDGAWLAVDDEEGMTRSAQRCRAMGFGGKLCIHPRQLAPVVAVFTPSRTEIERARRIVEAFATAEANGSAAIQVDGDLVDYPVARRAERLLASVGEGSRAP